MKFIPNARQRFLFFSLIFFLLLFLSSFSRFPFFFSSKLSSNYLSSCLLIKPFHKIKTEISKTSHHLFRSDGVDLTVHKYELPYIF